MAQVKFYSTSAADYAAQVSAETVNGGGVYFVDGGELYKGTQRFGLGRVTVDASFVPSTSTKDGQARGDIVVTGTGAGWVFDGEHWQSVGGDIGTITSAWQADISTWTSALAVGDANSYITSISQAADGKVTAHAESFGTKVLEAVGNGSASGSGNGITVSVVTTSGSVTGVEVAAANISATSVSAATGTFGNLTVTDTATFSATTVSATTLTIGGSTVEQLADKQIAAIAEATSQSTSAGITVGVTTSGGSVTAVTVNAGTFGNVMHFRDTVSNTANVTNPVAGDIVIITGVTDSESTFVNGQEYIYTTASTWELIGDQNSYALNAYAPTGETVTAGVTTLPAATHAIASKVDEIAAALSDFTYSSVTGGSSSSTVNGVTVDVVTAATTAAPTVTLTGVGTAASVDFATTVTSDGTALPTQSAVASYVTGVVEGLDANVSSSNHTGLTVSVAQADGVVTGVQAELVWLDANGAAIA